MQTKVISINRALKELKTLDSRIQSAISNGMFVLSAKNSASKINGLTREELKNSFKGNLDKVNDLVSYKNAIKAAIVASNAETEVQVAGVTYKVATAIYMKEAAKTEQYFINKLKQDYARVLREIEAENAKLEKAFETYVTQMYGGKDKAPVDEIEKARKMYYDTNGVEMIDSIGIKAEIERREEALVAFLDEVDGALTDSNALTQLTINW